MSIMNIDETAKYLIEKAEIQFGPMCSEWVFRGIEFNDGFPCLMYYPEVNGIKISLTNKAKEDYNQLLYQLAHEVCHLLYPAWDADTKTIEPTTILNEGVSTYFSTCIIGQKLGAEYVEDLIKLNYQRSPNYGNAMAAVIALLKTDEDSIIKLRKIEPKLNKTQLHHFEQANIHIESELKEELLKLFV